MHRQINQPMNGGEEGKKNRPGHVSELIRDVSVHMFAPNSISFGRWQEKRGLKRKWWIKGRQWKGNASRRHAKDYYPKPPNVRLKMNNLCINTISGLSKHEWHYTTVSSFWTHASRFSNRVLKILLKRASGIPWRDNPCGWISRMYCDLMKWPKSCVAYSQINWALRLDLHWIGFPMTISSGSESTRHVKISK